MGADVDAATGHVLVLAPMSADVVARHLPDVEVVAASTPEEALAAADGAVACVAGWDASGVVLDAGLADALAPTCRLVQVPAAGLDGLDLAALRERGVPVASAVGLNAVAVAEWVVWATIDALRGLSDAHAALGRGEWRMFSRGRHELRGRTVGVVGMGAVARAMLPRLRPFEVDLAYWSRSRHEDVEADGVRRLDLDDLVAGVDVLVLAVALTDATRGLLSARRVATMRPGAVVVNAARGEVWDGAAVAASVAADGGLLAAATDVFVVEPATADDPTVGVPGIVTTPHLAGPTSEVVDAIVGRVVDNLRAALAGGRVVGLVGD